LARYAGALAGGPRVVNRRIEWQEHSAGEMVSNPVAILWTGEVVFNRGRGDRLLLPMTVRVDLRPMLTPFAATRFLHPKERCPADPRGWHFVAPHVRSLGFTRPVRLAHGTSKTDRYRSLMGQGRLHWFGRSALPSGDCVLCAIDGA
jgi:hypothetical protein